MRQTGNWQRGLILPLGGLAAFCLVVGADPFCERIINWGRPALYREETAPVYEVAAAEVDDAGARAAFNAVADVFSSPRCKNCHAAGESPTQDDEGRPHDLNVTRGTTGRGKGGTRCNNCHQLSNGTEINSPPGSPDWRMPPPETPMVFANKTAAEICRQIKDPEQNGKKTLDDLLHHVLTDPRIQWAWTPGGDRTPAPRTYQDFVNKMTEWIHKGGACPD